MAGVKLESVTYNTVFSLEQLKELESHRKFVVAWYGAVALSLAWVVIWNFA